MDAYAKNLSAARDIARNCADLFNEPYLVVQVGYDDFRVVREARYEENPRWQGCEVVDTFYPKGR